MTSVGPEINEQQASAGGHTSAGSAEQVENRLRRKTVHDVGDDDGIMTFRDRVLEEVSLDNTNAIREGAAAQETERLIRAVIPFDRACWHNVDPATAMITTVYGDSAPATPLLPRLEYGDQDVNQYAALARRSVTVGILSQATRGDRTRSRRFREVLEPMGIGDELTAAFVIDSMAWGCVRLYRHRGRPDFESTEAAFVAVISPALAEAFRRSLLLPGLAVHEVTGGPGVILLDDRDRIEAVSASAQHWLREVIDIPRTAETALPHPVYAVAARARSIHKAADRASGRLARARVPTRSGPWLILHGMRLGGTTEGRTAVLVEPASSPELASLIVRAYGLSNREREVLQRLVQGLSTKEIAATLGISAYTVADHLKGIFEKVGVQSRTELMARVFFDHYYPRLLHGDVPDGDGQFSEPDAAESPG
jgi:DNA-binding CsgD family transcriptional regulator